MFNWIKKLFGNTDAVPVSIPSSTPIKKAKTVAPKSDTLFPRPAKIEVVKPTTESDNYRWLNDIENKVMVKKIESVVVNTNPPIQQPEVNTWGCSGVMFVTGYASKLINYMSGTVSSYYSNDQNCIDKQKKPAKPTIRYKNGSSISG